MGKCLHLYFVPSGRINRRSWWLSTIVLEFGLWVMIAATIEATHDHWTANLTASALVALMAVAFWCLIALSIKRLHDREHSAWVMLLCLVPVVGVLAMLVILGFLAGTEDANRYGTKPS